MEMKDEILLQIDLIGTERIGVQLNPELAKRMDLADHRELKILLERIAFIFAPLV